jgi:spore maturation protein CgeB
LYLRGLSETERRGVARSARERVLTQHTAAHRAAELVQAIGEVANAGMASLVAQGSA